MLNYPSGPRLGRTRTGEEDRVDGVLGMPCG